jgi:hypothetical protein
MCDWHPSGSQELTGPRLKALRDIASVCVNWLREADEEDDEE